MTAQVNAIIPSSLLLVLMWNKHDLTSRAWCNRTISISLAEWLKWLVNTMSLSISFTLSPKNTARFSAVPDERLASWNNRGQSEITEIVSWCQSFIWDSRKSCSVSRALDMSSVYSTQPEKWSLEKSISQNITLYTHYILLYLLVMSLDVYLIKSFMKKPLCKW